MPVSSAAAEHGELPEIPAFKHLCSLILFAFSLLPPDPDSVTRGKEGGNQTQGWIKIHWGPEPREKEWVELDMLPPGPR